MRDRVYLCIDLKSFYASVECVERGLDPLDSNLVVADERRTDKTIVLAVSPSLKSFGLPGRPRLFEVVRKVKDINAERALKSKKGLSGESISFSRLQADPSLSLSYIIARPRMATYLEYSTKIYNIYLKFVSPDDIHIYSVDEVFMDITGYLRGGKSPRDFAIGILREVIKETGITATAGIGTNLYLAKIAMDVTAKKMPPDKDGVRLAELDEQSYRRTLWDHRPLTDFWRVGAGYARRLEQNGMFTMGDIALCSMGGANEVHNEALLYRLFGVNAELLIDHAWGYEPCTIADIKSYKPETKSVGAGQVLQEPYDFSRARIVVREMAEHLSLDLLSKRFVTNQLVLTVGYDAENLRDPSIKKNYGGEITGDRYGRAVPKHAHGTANLGEYSSSGGEIINAVLDLYDKIIDKSLLIRRINLAACRVLTEDAAERLDSGEQLSFFEEQKEKSEEENRLRERRRQEAVIDIKSRFGKNSIILGTSLEEGATELTRNNQIGGHNA